MCRARHAGAGPTKASTLPARTRHRRAPGDRKLGIELGEIGHEPGGRDGQPVRCISSGSTSTPTTTWPRAARRPHAARAAAGIEDAGTRQDHASTRRASPRGRRRRRPSSEAFDVPLRCSGPVSVTIVAAWTCEQGSGRATRPAPWLMPHLKDVARALCLAASRASDSERL